MKKLAAMTLGLAITASSLGCYCYPGYGYGYGGGYGGSPCGPGGCPPAGAVPYNQGAYYNGYAAPAPVTAMAPLDALPTY
jgi:hypothetical protein